MAKNKPDFRKKLNTLLRIFYSENGVVAIKHLAIENSTILTYEELIICYDTLIADQYIKHIMPEKGWAELRVGVITGQGRIFYEQGGYQDKRNKVDIILDWFKNNTFFSWIIVGAIILTSIWGFIEIGIKIIELLRK